MKENKKKYEGNFFPDYHLLWGAEVDVLRFNDKEIMKLKIQ